MFSLDQSRWEMVRRFLKGVVDGRIDSADCVFWGAILVGLICGLLGSFVVLRKQSLMGDAIGHAVLPGVCAGFLLAGGRSGGALLAGGILAGVAASWLIAMIKEGSRLKSPEAIGVVFTGFYGLGIILLRDIQNRAIPGSAGLDKFLFGQIVGISVNDVLLLLVVAVVTVASLVVFWRKLKLSSFDPQFASSVGTSVRAVELLLTGLLTVAIVVSIQAVGVVLVAAMLVTPASTAYLLTDRLGRMAIFSAIIGAAAGVLGAILSLLGERLPTGALMVLSASALFGAAVLFSPWHGIVPRLVRLKRNRNRTSAENLLRTLYLILERRTGGDFRFGVHEVASARQETPSDIRRMAKEALKRGWLEPGRRDALVLTEQGLAEARRIVRNHRLWELYLTHEASLGADHVHAAAERIEHVLPADIVQRLESLLQNPTSDPHGRTIPRAGGG
jgi:manganese/zinc/iron transport system permease protein